MKKKTEWLTSKGWKTGNGTNLESALSTIEKSAITGDKESLHMLWEAVNYLMHLLGILAIRQKLVPIRIIDNIAQICVDATNAAVEFNSGEALALLYGLTHRGCELLRAAAYRDSKFVACFAERSNVWPVPVANTKACFEDIARYLTKIQLGRYSVRFVSTVVDGKNRPTQLAAMLLDQIRSNQTWLRRKSEWNRLPKGVRKTGEEVLRWNAKDFPQVSKLPPLVKATRQKWWEVADTMLERYWERYPDQARLDLKISKTLAMKLKGEGRSAKTYQKGKVRKAFLRLAKPLFEAAVAQA